MTAEDLRLLPEELNYIAPKLADSLYKAVLGDSDFQTGFGLLLGRYLREGKTVPDPLEYIIARKGNVALRYRNKPPLYHGAEIEIALGKGGIVGESITWEKELIIARTTLKTPPECSPYSIHFMEGENIDKYPNHSNTDRQDRWNSVEVLEKAVELIEQLN